MPANQDLLDAALRHQVHVRRFASGEAARMLDLLEKADQDVTLQIRTELRKLIRQGGDPRDSRNIKRLEAVLKEIRRERERVIRAIADGVEVEMIRFGEAEADFEIRALDRAIPISIALPTVTPGKVKAIVQTQPFAGRALGDWWQSLAEADRRRVLEQIRLGYLEGQSLDRIVQRVAGTRAGRFTDGVLAVTRRQAEAIVRTGVNGISNAARQAVWDAKAEYFEALAWNATLDGHTTDICRARDGKLRAISPAKPLPNTIGGDRRLTPPYAAPPAHPQCRSVLIPFLDGVGLLGERPFVRDKRNRRLREMDFRAQAKAEAGPEWRGKSEAWRRARIKDKRDAWASANIGRVPADTDYQTWLTRQPAAFQDDVLGKTRAALFRRGGVKLDQFVDFNGETLTLAQLRRKMPEAFATAGVP